MIKIRPTRPIELPKLSESLEALFHKIPFPTDWVFDVLVHQKPPRRRREHWGYYVARLSASRSGHARDVVLYIKAFGGIVDRLELDAAEDPITTWYRGVVWEALSEFLGVVGPRNFLGTYPTLDRWLKRHDFQDPSTFGDKAQSVRVLATDPEVGLHPLV